MAAPLTPAVLHILLAVSAEGLHGYAIMKRVLADSDSRVKMGPGTLYGSVKRMIDAGLVRESDSPDPDDDRRVRYEITAVGRQALAAELDRYRDVVAIADRGAAAAGSRRTGDDAASA